jgi:hypothetical protein
MDMSLRPGRLTDYEIKAELETAAAERRAELEGELAERKRIRASIGQSPRVASGGFWGGQRGTKPADA